MSESMTTESHALRGALETLLGERLDNKLKTSGDDPAEHAALQAQFQREAWLEDAARRAAQLQVVTHSLKPVHPDARGTNLYAPPDTAKTKTVIDSHVLGDDFAVDVVGNAAALDVFKLLQLSHEGKTLLERVKADDPALHGAFCDDADAARRWMDAFAAITEASGDFASHTRAKQLYWLTGEEPTDDKAFHLIAPLYATALAHRVFRTINDDRFSDTAKAARKARYDKQPSDAGYCDYPGLAVQKFGGSKPQNISQLNSERGGTNYLLASMPPRWQSRNARPPLNMRSAFRLFGFRNEVRRILRDLRRLLGSDPKPVMDTRDRRDELTEALMDELLVFTVDIQNLPPGWSADAQCRIEAEQQFWLDPGRARTDADFRSARAAADWPAAVRAGFARWLNHRLSRPLVMSDTEHREWARQAHTDMDFQRFLDIDRAWMEKLADELDGLEGALDHE